MTGRRSGIDCIFGDHRPQAQLLQLPSLHDSSSSSSTQLCVRMTALSHSSLEPGRNYGIPARTSASTALWAHLLRKDKLGPLPNSDIIIPPITPLDKNGTSMRILLHDTQAHLDTFSVRVDKLCSGLDETKHEILTVNTLFQREHDSLTGELVDLVNRSQTQLQTSIGSPAQTEQLGRLSKDLNTHLEALNKRIDAIQLFNQTHSQALQLQSQVLHSLQDQHGTVIAALMPLLPLLQAIPLHIESARNNLTDTITKSARSLTGTSESPGEITHSKKAIDHTYGHKRSSSTLYSGDSPSPLTNKRPRITTNKETLEPSRAYDEPDLTDGDLSVQTTRTEINLTTLSEGACLSSSLTPSSLARRDTNVTPSLHPLPSGSVIKEPETHVSSKKTPKRQIGNQNTIHGQALYDREPTADITSSSPGFSDEISPSTTRPPRPLRGYSTSSQAKTDAQLTSTTIRQDAALAVQPATKPHLPPKPLAPLFPSTPSTRIKRSEPFSSHSRRDPNTLSPTARNAQERDQSPHMSRLSTPLAPSRLPLLFMPLGPPVPQLDGKSMPPMLPPGHGPRSNRTSRASTPSFSTAGPTTLRAALVSRNVASIQHVPFPPPSQPRPLQSENSTILPAPRNRSGSISSMKLPAGTTPSKQQNLAPNAKVRERRSPFRKGRRFIPLGDSEDDDDENQGG
ncbi:hypothetical protein FPV67DRAFT_1474705 [Lyophyllum atratum]|nr:hypothetical protein FPV67DRAFT_1474705 [Lyophyllum atratum]